MVEQARSDWAEEAVRRIWINNERMSLDKNYSRLATLWNTTLPFTCRWAPSNRSHAAGQSTNAHSGL